MLLNYNPKHCLPSAEDLPDSDDTPVDNQLQDLIPHLLLDILALIWSDRQDWYFGVDMGIYYDPYEPAIIPDGFLSVGVPRIIDEDLRLSYVLWEEQKVPTLVLEVVSHKRRKEYTKKKDFYAEMGVLYYVIYNPLRKRKPRLEVYQLNNGKYELLPGEPIWLSELSLGIGKETGIYQGIEREWLYWYDENGKRYLTPEERIKSEGDQRQKKGEIEGKRMLISRQLNLKLGNISLATEQQIKQLSSSQLDDLSLALFEFTDLDSLNQWLDEK